MNRKELKDKFTTHNLETHFDRIDSALRNAIRLYQHSAEENNIVQGQTKIGGCPDLPSSISWPTETNTTITKEKRLLFFSTSKSTVTTKSLSFIAQINLAEVKAYDEEQLLPSSGMLYFFYSAEQETAGFDPADKDSFKVIYYDGDRNGLRRVNFPNDLPGFARYKPCTVTIQKEISVPSADNDIFDELEEEEAEELYNEIFASGNVNKLLGHSDNIQNEMELECELVTNGLYCGNATGYNDPRAAALEPNAKNWRLLLQIDSNEENDMMWGDVGRLYFWIKKDDLLNKRFDKSWFIFQCC